ncbi:MAG: membrane protein insertion efficiency factor YidD [Deltaproteobacteria bacterium]|nr:membrane protein insertion efficiency factor YidD [Deltaproteobacteria bacterium]
MSNGNWELFSSGTVAAAGTGKRSRAHGLSAVWLSPLFLALIALYQKAISPLLGANCRFHPTCSNYAAEAIERHGPFRGSAHALGRIVRCHPWNPGGYDPVPRPRDFED